MLSRTALNVAALLALAGVASAQFRPDAVLIRFPDVSRDHIAFRYDGDVWIVDKQGGEARRISSAAGNESFPRFSPDGTRLAIVGGYEGSSDLYTLDLQGGLPERVTYHPGQEMLCDWHPNGEELLFWSNRESGIARAPKLFLIPAGGGAARELPVPYGTFGTIDETGTWLAYTPRTREFRTWKRYQGGMAQDVWLFNLETLESRKITDHPGTDSLPMWHGQQVVFLSDRGQAARMNLWSHDTASGRTSQLTNFTDWDVKFPSVGPDDVVFESGGRLWRYEFASGRSIPVDVVIPGDRRALRTKSVDVSSFVSNVDVGPSGQRIVVEARGNLFTAPVEEGFVRTLTSTSSAAERDPAWSPDGKWIAYWSDADGEYELWVRRSDGRAFTWGDGEESVQEVKVAATGGGWKNTPQWSPDSEKIVFSTNRGVLSLVDVGSGEITELDRSPVDGRMSVSWSADSSWLAWDRVIDGTLTTAIRLHELATGTTTAVTSELFSNSDPVFDANGDWLYYTSSRTFEPTYSDFDDSWIYANSTNLCAVPLRGDVENPWAPENDEEFDADEEDEGEDEEDEEGADADAGEGEDASPADEDSDAGESSDDEGSGAEEAGGDEAEASGGEDEDEGEDSDEEDEDDEDEPLVIELDDFEARAILLPVPEGRIAGLSAVEGRVVYLRRPRTGADGGRPSLCMYELGADEEQTIVSGVNGYGLAANGEKVLVRANGGWAVVDLKPGQKVTETIDLSGLRSNVDPRAEWAQILHDVWILMRDFFYDPGLHGVDWDGLRDRYVAALEFATSRDDVHYLIGEMIAELNVGHAYNRAPSEGLRSPDDGPVAGLVGCDWEVHDGHWRIAAIIDGGDYDYDARNPLEALGVDARVGDYLLAVNGQPVDDTREVWAWFLGTAGEPTELVLNETPALDGNERRVLVEPVSSDRSLRYRAWVAHKRAVVDELSDGRVGYVHVPDTGRNGQNELVRQYAGQYHEDALLIDERWNGGGQIPTRFIELLNRPTTNYWATNTSEFSWPMGAHQGPKAMLINESAGSGGDAFPYYFRQAGLGELIGTRTWGGLVGISGGPRFVDGATISVPSFAFFELDQTWGVEGHGVAPDIEVVDDPTELAKGRDPQLEAAVEHLLEELETWEFPRPERPEAPIRTGPGVRVEDF